MFYSYSPTYRKLDEYVNTVVEFLTDRPGCLIVQGTSGLIVGLLAAKLLRRPLVVVRKPNENAHGCDVERLDWRGEGLKSPIKGWIVDDFISSGATIKRIMYTLKKQESFQQFDVLGVVCYMGRSNPDVIVRYDEDENHPMYFDKDGNSYIPSPVKVRSFSPGYKG